MRARWLTSLALAVFVQSLCLTCAAPGAGAPPHSSAPLVADPTATPLESAPPSTQPTPSPTPPRWASAPVAADEPAALAEQISMAERAVRDPTVTGQELAWMGHLQQLVYRRLVARPELREGFIAALPADLRPTATANLNATADLRALVTPRDTLPPWKIVDPAPPDELLADYRAAEAEFGVPWSYLAAIHLVETRMGRIRGTSIAGAQGPMQFMPATWAAYGEGDVNSNRDAIRAAARYLRANGAPRNMANALFRYNNSERYVRAVTAYAEIMRANPDAYRGYYHWQVYYITTRGDVLLPVGYGASIVSGAVSA